VCVLGGHTGMFQPHKGASCPTSALSGASGVFPYSSSTMLTDSETPSSQLNCRVSVSVSV